MSEIGAAIPACPHCGLVTLDGGPCGRDACPGEATRERASFGSPPPPRQPAAWKRAEGLRLQRGWVMEIQGVRLTASDQPLGLHGPRGTGWRWRAAQRVRAAWRRLRERWVMMWERIAGVMGVTRDDW